MGEASKTTDVIIVGAGLSGLVAAEFLKTRDPNLNVLILEAAAQLGGRTHGGHVSVANHQPEEVDLGGEWLLPSQINLLRVIDRLGLQTYSPIDVNSEGGLKKLVQVGRKCLVRPTRADSGAILPTKFGWQVGIRSWMAGLELSYIAWQLDWLCAAVDLVDPYNTCFRGGFNDQLRKPIDFDSMTADTFLRLAVRFQSVRDIIQIQIQLVCGVDLNRISLLYLLFYVKSQYPVHDHPFSSFLWGDASSASSGPPLRVKNGAFQICRRLSQLVGVDQILLNQTVESITLESVFGKDESKESYVLVTTNTGTTYRCQRLILAVPPPVIRRICFSPPFPPHKAFLVDQMTSGNTIKFYATYDEPYWRRRGYSGDFLSNGGSGRYVGLPENETGNAVPAGGPITWMTDGTSVSHKAPMLVGFLGGRLATDWSSAGEEDFKSAVLDQLSSLYGSWAREPAGFISKTWGTDLFSAVGPLAVPAVGTMFAYHALRKPFGPIHFAGTETAVNYIGTMSGAVEAGQRAAVEVMDEIRPQCLTAQDYVLLVGNRHDSPKSGRPFNNNNEADFSTSFSVLKWTLVLPLVGIGLSGLAYHLCDKYGRLLIPR